MLNTDPPSKPPPSPRSQRRAWTTWVLSLAVCAAFGCATPTLPLPPPVAEVSAPNADGQATVTGVVVRNAYVSCVNERLSRGVIVLADGDGKFSLSVEAQSGDDLTVWQNVEDERGPSLHVVVPEPRP